MNYFETLEASSQYLSLLVEAVRENQIEIDKIITEVEGRRRDAFIVVRRKLAEAAIHLDRSRVILNDLKMLERILHD